MGIKSSDAEEKVKMVDVSDKLESARIAVAHGSIRMKPETLTKIRLGQLAKGDVLAVAQVAGIMAAKQTAHLIPMCHPLVLTGVELKLRLEDPDKIDIEAKVKVFGKTGVEMEALTAVSIAALTIYDMCRATDKTLTIQEIYLTEKLGGKSGHFIRENYC